MARIRTAVFPVAGLGTRMLPATKVMPKEMLPVVDKPVIQYAFEEAAAAGIERFVFVTGRGKTLIEDHFDRAYELFDTLQRKNKTAVLADLEASVPVAGEVIYTRQQEPHGLGHAVWCARHIVGEEPFAVLLVDELLLSDPPPLVDLCRLHERTGGNVISVVEVPAEHTSRYGIIATGKVEDELIEVTGMVEKPKPEDAPSRLSIIGRYVLVPEVFAHLEKGERGAGGEIQLTDAMQKLIGTSAFHAAVYRGGRYDCGDKLGYVEAVVAAALRRPDLAEGVREVLARHR
ncbi:MAG TPA: UTP--glucose-1-phosphate uridylyltransferase GalU [Geminicoccus sp.]|jgi:UTP--glucose-1-phosphate uridylyltransferase|uniref:UTP--glucose-1-phosphate uridylyltransferase GalU n=1 Tax=Geminicoccus sp. TaxID=2024832 RepID=UPI002E2F9E33|nr:UTP--glucose-1-phosphate uridylyltransferase GalU [Geminicoccus sp.]HEX2529501.1 UTP--glucose-1-phosphate uridylyltransferase GalU [Geminicoccus sp.]